MLIIKYKKIGTARFIPHLDLLRHIQRTVRRGEIEVEYSVGFNPHQLIFMTSPIPLGLESHCEYFAIKTPLTGEEFLKRFVPSAIEGFVVTGIASANTDPKLGGLATEAEYEITGKGLAEHIELILKRLNMPDLTYTFTQKGKLMEKRVDDKLRNVAFSNGVLSMHTAFGQNNLRPDRLLSSVFVDLNIKLDIDIIKKNVYTNVNADQTISLDVVLGIEAI